MATWVHSAVAATVVAGTVVDAYVTAVSRMDVGWLNATAYGHGTSGIGGSSGAYCRACAAGTAGWTIQRSNELVKVPNAGAEVEGFVDYVVVLWINYTAGSVCEFGKLKAGAFEAELPHDAHYLAGTEAIGPGNLLGNCQTAIVKRLVADAIQSIAEVFGMHGLGLRCITGTGAGVESKVS